MPHTSAPQSTHSNLFALSIGIMLALEEVLCELHGEHTNEQGLPPGFRFHPTDEELVTFYLASKVFHGTFSGVDIAEIDLNRCEPWELPDRAKIGEREWYFFSLRDRKYPTGLRTNRATGAGYWKATGKDKEIYSAASPTNSNVNPLLGMKKTLVFYKGRAPRGQKTKWVMHEYRLVDQPSSSRHTCKDEWVICRIQHKAPSPGSGSASGGEDKKTPSLLNNYLLKPTSFSSSSLPPLFESSTQIHPQELTPIPPAVSMGFQPTSFASSCLTNNANPSQSSLLMKTLLSNQDCSSWNEQYDEIRNYSTQVVEQQLNANNNMQWARMQQQQKDVTSSSLCSDMHGGLWGWSQKYGGNVCSSDNVNRASFHMMLDPLFRASPLEFGTLNV